MRIVVAGAGLAGLACAYELLQAGHEVTVLEGQDRVGGRVQTQREPFSDGLYAEAGALFIPASHILVQDYARSFALRLVGFPRPRLPQTYAVRGRRVVERPGVPPLWPLDLRPHERTTMRVLASRYLSAKDADDQETVSAFLLRHGASEDAVSLLGMGLIGIWGDGPESCSAAALLHAVTRSGASEEVYTIHGGNDLLAHAFGAALGNQIRMRCRLLRVAQSPRSVAVAFRHGAETVSLEADRLISALPLPTLRNIHFDPPLSKRKVRAHKELEYTSVTRIFLQFRERFWLSQGSSGFGATDAPRMRIRECFSNDSSARGILECWFNGSEARYLASLPNAARLDFALVNVERLHPGARDYFETGTCKCWDEDEWASGAYVYFKPGQMSAFHHELAYPEGHVHFAGDHTSSWWGWMEGALESASRVVQEITFPARRSIL